MFMNEYVIDLNWDAEAEVWVAVSDNIPGLALESGSYDALVERVRYAVPELLALNKLPVENSLLYFKSERQERAYA